MTVEVTTGWSAPDAPRDFDEAATADVPDIARWLAVLDHVGPQGRLGLHGRALTQLVRGEPVLVAEEAGEWLGVFAPWQPSSRNPAGYPAWVRRSHVSPAPAVIPRPVGTGLAAERVAITEAARSHLGLRYLWAGTTPYGLDCSGLVHDSYRQAGIVVPRDARDQCTTAVPVPLGEEQPGDLYFFARPDGTVFHVGFVTGERTMLHAPETGQLLEEAPLAPERAAALCAVGRFLT